MIRLIIQTDTPDEDANRVTKYLQHIVLRQGVGIDPMEVVIDPPSLQPYDITIPVMTMGPKSMSVWMLGEDRVTEFHGHIHLVNGRLMSHTFDIGTAITEPSYLPVIIQEISNVLHAASSPSLLSLPDCHGHFKDRFGDTIVVDLEWDAKNRPTIVGIADSPREAYSTYQVTDALTVVRDYLRTGKTVVNHNLISADLPHIGMDLVQSFSPEHIFDTFIAAHILHPHLAGYGLYDLGSLVRMYFPTGDWKHDQFDELTYNGLDCAYTFKLYEAMKQELIDSNQWKLMEWEQTWHYISLQMKARGIRIDSEALKELVNNKKDRNDNLKGQLPFNPNSHIQIKKWLYEQFKIRVPNTQYDTLKKLKGRDEQIDTLIEYKEDAKSVSTWFDYEADKYGTYISSPELIHPKFNATGTNVVRFSSSGPNFQNLPPHVRHCIVPRSSGSELVAFDASQGENRWVAFLANDDVMLSGFDSGLDNHAIVARRISDAAGFEVTRDFGKTVVHASNYGETATHLAERLFGNRKRDSVFKAKQLQDAYFRAYEKTREWQREISEQLDSGDIVLTNGYGRKRAIYAINSHERMKRGCHYLGCSSLGEQVNRAMVRVYRELGLYPIMIVHDELVYELKIGDKETAWKIWNILTGPVVEMGGRPGKWSLKVGRNYRKFNKKTGENLNGLVEMTMEEFLQDMRAA